MILNDPDGPWTAAAYLADDPQFHGTQHGIEDMGTLCGLPDGQVVIVRNPFYGRKPGDCPLCAERLNVLGLEAARER